MSTSAVWSDPRILGNRAEGRKSHMTPLLRLLGSVRDLTDAGSSGNPELFGISPRRQRP